MAQTHDVARVNDRPQSRDLALYLDLVVNLILLAVIVLPPALAISSVRLDPVLPFDLVVWCSAGGLLLGTFFALSGLPGVYLHPIAIVGGVASAVFGTYSAAVIVARVPSDASFVEQFAEVERELANWIGIVVAGGQATNNLLFLLLLSVIGGTVGYFSAWAVFREQSVWWPVTVSATALTLVLATFPRFSNAMIAQLLAAMLLVGRVNLRNYQDAWEERGIRQSVGVTGRAFRASLILAVALVLLTWVLPALIGTGAASERLGRADGPWQTAQTQFNRLFGGLQAQNDAAVSGFSRSLTLHGAFHLADTPVLKIQSPKPAYWRVMVFDRYNGHGWISTDPVDQRSLPAGSDVLHLQDERRVDLTQLVTVLTPRGNYLAAASQPASFDRPILAQAYPDLPGRSVDLVSTTSTQAIERNTKYAVISKVSEASGADLRAATRTYSAEVRQRYLSLPSIPSRVRQLADQLTASEPTPYDKAVAVESYLRSLPYTLDPPTPPANQDGVDFFLFDAKTGYCDYFASAMAVMLRAEGVPARVVSGYSTGEPQDDGSFLVKDSDSHTWTEVYLPPYGWIPFEPSGGWPRFSRGNGNQGASTPTVISTPQAAANQSSQQATPSPTPSPTPEPGSAAASTTPDTKDRLDLSFLLPVLVVLAILALIILVIWYLWEKDLRGLPPSVVAYVKMSRLAALLGFGVRPSETPAEYGSALSGAVPEASTSTSRIATDYARYRFGHQAPDPDVPSILHWRFVRNALLRRFGRLRRN